MAAVVAREEIVVEARCIHIKSATSNSIAEEEGDKGNYVLRKGTARAGPFDSQRTCGGGVRPPNARRKETRG